MTTRCWEKIISRHCLIAFCCSRAVLSSLGEILLAALKRSFTPGPICSICWAAQSPCSAQISAPWIMRNVLAQSARSWGRIESDWLLLKNGILSSCAFTRWASWGSSRSHASSRKNGSNGAAERAWLTAFSRNKTSPTCKSSLGSRANQPTVSKLLANGLVCSKGIRPWVGRIP